MSAAITMIQTLSNGGPGNAKYCQRTLLPAPAFEFRQLRDGCLASNGSYRGGFRSTCVETARACRHPQRHAVPPAAVPICRAPSPAT